MTHTVAATLLAASIAATLILQPTAALPCRRPQQASNSQPKQVVPDVYAGDDVCRSCHRDIVETFLQTAHHLTSRPANRDSIAGKFSRGENILRTSNPGLYFRMEANENGYFQTVVDETLPTKTMRSEPLDLVIGSGRKGQTYLFWKDDQLFQLPVSYWTELNQWVNSPGYRDGTADFNRRVIPRCLECHATYFESLAPPLNRYKKKGFVLGIACEKCHGPGREHVARYSSTSVAPGGTAIVNPAKLSRDKQISICALCHAGLGEPAPRAAFSFVPGDQVEDYLQLEPLDPNAAIDVHGSQVELLKKSRCFQSSKRMTCSNCHNVHLPQRDAPAFSAHCLTCHKVESCGVYAKMGRQIAENCIDCHMPRQETNLIVSDSNGSKVKPRVRNHWIRIHQEYPVH